MRSMSRNAAERILSSVGLTVGDWNEMKEVSGGGTTHCAFVPPEGALELYVLSRKLSGWLGPGEWVLAQFDRSSWPQEDEKAVLEVIGFSREDLKGPDFEGFYQDGLEASPERAIAKVAMLVFHAIVFQWHLHLATDRSVSGRRLALLDGVVHGFGSEEDIESLRSLMR